MDASEHEVTQAGGSKPTSDGRAMSSAANGRRGGRPRIRLDAAKWNRLFFDGISDKDAARALGVSRARSSVAKRDRQSEDSPIL